MMIRNNGLGATLAFMFSKAMKDKRNVLDLNKAYGLLYYQIADWFINYHSHLISDLKSHKELVSKVIALDSSAYRAATIEVLALFNWIRRFTDGLIEGEPEDNNEN